MWLMFYKTGRFFPPSHTQTMRSRETWSTEELRVLSLFHPLCTTSGTRRSTRAHIKSRTRHHTLQSPLSLPCSSSSPPFSPSHRCYSKHRRCPWGLPIRLSKLGPAPVSILLNYLPTGIISHIPLDCTTILASCNKAGIVISSCTNIFKACRAVQCPI